MSKRTKPSSKNETQLFLKSGRRCCICYNLNGDFTEKHGQVAHLNRDPSNSLLENLVWLCLSHHDEHDTKRSQTKRYTVHEVRKYRSILYKKVSEERKKVDEVSSFLDQATEARVEPPEVDASPKLPMPPDPPPEQRKVSKDERKAMKLASSGCDEDIRIKLRTLLYSTTDPYAQINCIYSMLNCYDLRKDTITEMMALCDQGIQTAQRMNLIGAEAVLLANKGNMLSFDFIQEDMNGYMSVYTNNVIGVPAITEIERQDIIDRLRNLQETYKNLFKEAMTKAHAANDKRALASIFLQIGTAAGQRYIHFHNLGVQDRAASEKSLTRSALMGARDAYAEMGDELSSAYALHQLANQVRFFGETEEAKEVCRQVIRLAKKHKDSRWLKKAEQMLARIKSGIIPDYINGEEE